MSSIVCKWCWEAEIAGDVRPIILSQSNNLTELLFLGKLGGRYYVSHLDLNKRQDINPVLLKYIPDSLGRNCKHKPSSKITSTNTWLNLAQNQLQKKHRLMFQLWQWCNIFYSKGPEAKEMILNWLGIFFKIYYCKNFEKWRLLKKPNRVTFDFQKSRFCRFPIILKWD